MRYEHQLRTAGGRWRKTTLSDLGVNQSEVNPGKRMVCKHCGYGTSEIWYPIMLTGYCPKCEGTEKVEWAESASI
jgi:predicted Zn-ribbon and HTH transcriptional regulator